MTPRTVEKLLLRVENAAAGGGYPCLEARAAVATWLMAELYGWPAAQETLTDRQWWRLLDILQRAELSVPADFTGPLCPPEAFPVDMLGAFGRGSAAGSLLALKGCRFKTVQYLGPLITPGRIGTVKAVEYRDNRWQVVVECLGVADQRIPLGMFVSCCRPIQSETSDAASGCPRSPQPAARPGAPQGRQKAGAGAAGGCGPTGATSTDSPSRAS